MAEAEAPECSRGSGQKQPAAVRRPKSWGGDATFVAAANKPPEHSEGGFDFAEATAAGGRPTCQAAGGLS